jgi:hypothetical protein
MGNRSTKKQTTGLAPVNNQIKKPYLLINVMGSRSGLVINAYFETLFYEMAQWRDPPCVDSWHKRVQINGEDVTLEIFNYDEFAHPIGEPGSTRGIILCYGASSSAQELEEKYAKAEKCQWFSKPTNVIILQLEQVPEGTDPVGIAFAQKYNVAHFLACLTETGIEEPFLHLATIMLATQCSNVKNARPQ